jgi:hypothetical protein
MYCREANSTHAALHVYACQERNVAMELDLARAAVETVVRQLAAVSKTNQVGLALATAGSMQNRSQPMSLIVD